MDTSKASKPRRTIPIRSLGGILIVFAAGAGVSIGKEPAQTPAMHHGGGGGGGAGGSTVVTITLPPDTSVFPPGPDMPLTDAAAVECMTCHDGVEATPVSELQKLRSPYFELVNYECHECHSADYVLYQPPLDMAGWAKVVKKMADVFDTAIVDGVPVGDVMFNPEHQEAMTHYLTMINGIHHHHHEGAPP